MNEFEQIQLLLQEKTDYQARINLIPYDGNKRASVFFANHFLIAHGQGFLVVPEDHVPEFKEKLVAYYEGEDIKNISEFLKEKFWKNF